jgi:hypothetical protein
MTLNDFITQTLQGTDWRSIGLSFLLLVAYTVFLIYLVALTTSKFTYIRSHKWVLIEALVVCALCFGLYRLYVWQDLRSLWWAIPMCLFAGVVNVIVMIVDRVSLNGYDELAVGRSLIDVDADKKGSFQTDARLIQRAAMLGLLMMWMFWRSFPPSAGLGDAP